MREPGTTTAATSVGACAAPPPARRVSTTAAPSRWLAVVLIAAVALPVLAAGVSIWNEPWTPVGDEAVIALRVDDVGGAATPLVGPYSTRGWSHPGPALYAILAVPHALGGLSESSMFASTGLVNALAIVAIGLVAWRLGRLRLVAATAVGLAWLVHGIRPDILVSFWNPYIALLPYVVFLYAAWAVACRHWRWLPVAAATGSVLVQLHVAYTTLVVSAVVLVAIWLRQARHRDPTRPSRRSVHLTVAAVAVLWAPVAWDLAVGSHNLARVTAYFPRPKEDAAGFATGFGILSRHLGPTGPWSGGDEVIEFLDVQPGSMFTLVALVVVIALLAVACARRGQHRPAALLALVLTQIVAAALSASRIERPILSYLVVWMLPLAMVMWVAIGWSLWELVRHRADRPRMIALHPRLARPARTLAVAVSTIALVAVPLVRTGRAWLEPTAPRQQHAEAVRSMIGQIEQQYPPDTRLRVEAVGDFFNEAGTGVIAGLIDDGYTVYTSDGAPAGKWGASRAWVGQEVDATITLAVAPNTLDVARIDQCDLAPGVVRVAAFNALGPGEFDELKWLALERYLQGGLLHPDKQKRFDELERRSFRIAAFEASHVCAS